jgi:hypothetical protein
LDQALDREAKVRSLKKEFQDRKNAAQDIGWRLPGDEELLARSRRSPPRTPSTFTRFPEARHFRELLRKLVQSKP